MKTIYTTIGASNHSDTIREEHDFYATFPEAIDRLFEVETFSDTIWEPACGMGHLSERMIKLGKTVYSTDLINRGYGTGDVDFLKAVENHYGDIITNPPYKIALEFIKKALEISEEGTRIAMFLKLTFLEGKRRKPFFQSNPPRRIHVFSSRAVVAKGGDFTTFQAKENAIAYAWFVWEKGYKGENVVDWIN
ncbi:hypothetical protein [Bacteroides gallinarum]|uniref:hypothetical protein n=1 Tax=Bacteroides gallinarum TaxID=376806 RepID=UPI0003A3A12F|nr:hypothetical protein [Bacteroides gallinarum]